MKMRRHLHVPVPCSGLGCHLEVKVGSLAETNGCLKLWQAAGSECYFVNFITGVQHLISISDDGLSDLRINGRHT